MYLQSEYVAKAKTGTFKKIQKEKKKNKKEPAKDQKRTRKTPINAIICVTC